MTSRYDLDETQFAIALQAFRDAVAAASGQTAFANICRCSQGNISQLLANQSLLPERFVLKAEAGTGISRTLLRPDIYPPCEPQVPTSATVQPVGRAGSGVAFDRRAGMKRAAGA